MISTDTSANVIQRVEDAHDARAEPSRGLGVVALAWLAAYVGATALVLGAGGHWRLVTAHVVVLIVSAWAARSRTTVGRATRDLLPLFVAPILYGELPQLIAVVGTSYHDSTVQALEAGVFGNQPSRTVAGLLPLRMVSELLHAGYLAYYAMIFVPPLLLFRRQERRGFGEMVLALTVTYTICWMVFVVFPVEGPRYQWLAPPGIPDGPVRHLALGILAAGSSRGAAFPSSHMAVATVIALMSYRWLRGQAWLWITIAALVGAGAVYGGFHYAVDVLAGMALGVFVAIVVVSHSRKRDAARLASLA